MSAVTEPSPVRRQTKGQLTRKQILQAAIEVLATHGIKGTTHRAIAKHAQIQLSLTTYYFKDIQTLVHQAFTLNSSNITAKASAAWLPAFELLDSYTKSQLKKNATRAELANTLAAMATTYIVDNVKHNAVELAVKQLLFTEIQISPQLRELADSHRATLLSPFINLCNYFNKATAMIDADILLTLITQLEYRHIMIPKEHIDETEINSKVQRLLNWILQVKQ